MRTVQTAGVEEKANRLRGLAENFVAKFEVVEAVAFQLHDEF